jgi:apolipoprotein N-acyltransferase
VGQLKKIHLAGLSALSGILLSLAWPEIGNMSLLALVGFVPLLFVHHYIKTDPDRRPIHFFLYSYITFIIWNVATTWWVWNATAEGSIAAFVFNALFMSVVMMLFHVSSRILNEKAGYAALVSFWLAWEYLHLSWDLTWPWLTLGNVFANSTKIIQWYEFTGVLGGSVWILIINILVFVLLRDWFKSKLVTFIMFKNSAWLVLIFTVPVVYSVFRYNYYSEIENPINVVVVQPNIDPYHEKFDGLPPKQQLEKMNSLAAALLDETVDYVVFPETALPQGIWENELEGSAPVADIREFIAPFPKLHYVTGLTSFRQYRNGEKPSPTARPFRDGSGSYDVYNTAMQIDNSGNIQLYHKSKLVPGVEKMPFPAVFGFLENLAIDLGGMTGSHGIDDERAVFGSIDSRIGVAPVICYESIYCEFVGQYVQNGANVIFIITNDGWWGDTPGYKQHLAYARLKAISNRRSIARSANTGISCFIDQRGDVQQATGWWVPDAIKQEINANDEITFYVAQGDYLARVAVLMTFLLLLWTIARSLNKTNQRLKVDR